MIAVIQSTKALDTIESIIFKESRLQTIMSKSGQPTLDRSEAEIAGYRDVFKLIHASAEDISINANILLQLQKELYKFVSVEIGRYISLEKIFKSRKEHYYESLRISSIRWHQN